MAGPDNLNMFTRNGTLIGSVSYTDVSSSDDILDIAHWKGKDYFVTYREFVTGSNLIKLLRINWKTGGAGTAVLIKDIYENADPFDTLTGICHDGKDLFVICSDDNVHDKIVQITTKGVLVKTIDTAAENRWGLEYLGNRQFAYCTGTGPGARVKIVRYDKQNNKMILLSSLNPALGNNEKGVTFDGQNLIVSHRVAGVGSVNRITTLGMDGSPKHRIVRSATAFSTGATFTGKNIVLALNH